MCDQQYFCGRDILESGWIIGLASFVMDSICSYFDFAEVIGRMRERNLATKTAVYYICALTVYVGAAIQNLMICCASEFEDLSKFFDTYNGVSFLFCIFAFFDAIFYSDRTALMVFFFACAALNVFFLISTCSLKKEMKRERQRASSETRVQVFETSTVVHVSSPEGPAQFEMALNVESHFEGVHK